MLTSTKKNCWGLSRVSAIVEHNRALWSDSMEALQHRDADLVVYLHPSKSKNVKDAIYRELSDLLFKFNECLDGVVLAYEPEFRITLAKILPGIQPYFGVRFQAKLLTFNPKPDMLLEGEVVKVAPQSIHIVVLGFSSGVVAVEDMSGKFKYKITHGEEVFVSKSHKRHKIKVGTIVRFSVKRNERRRTMTIRQCILAKGEESEAHGKYSENDNTSINGISEEEYGFAAAAGPLAIPCDEAVFEEIIRFMAARSDPSKIAAARFEDFQRHCHVGIRNGLELFPESRPLLRGENSTW
nr:uncharacterized protein LOC109152908 [Ipomoea batatas]